MKEVNIEKAKNLGSKAGYILGGIIFGCLASIVVALTIKLIMWMF